MRSLLPRGYEINHWTGTIMYITHYNFYVKCFLYVFDLGVDYEKVKYKPNTLGYSYSDFNLGTSRTSLNMSHTLSWFFVLVAAF